MLLRCTPTPEGANAASSDPFHPIYGPGPGAVSGVRSGADPVGAGLQHGAGPTAAAPRGPRAGSADPGAGDPAGEAALRPRRGDRRGQLLRGRPRWLLVASGVDGGGDPEPGGGCRELRGATAGAAGADGSGGGAPRSAAVGSGGPGGGPRLGGGG